MCNLKTLHHNELGYVAKCKKCNHIQLAFGTVAITQEEGELYQFKKFISKHLATNNSENETICPNQKNIYLQTPVSNILFVFSKNELKLLNELLEQSILMLEVEKIFYVNEN